MDDTLKVILTVIGTLLSGATAAKYVEWRSQKEKNRLDELSLQRKELREDNQALEKQVDHWREKFFAFREETMGKMTRLEFENVQLKERIVALERILAGNSGRKEPGE
jgi:predicted nuclease with TOPRIM domain